jgi:hypothetical protein
VSVSGATVLTSVSGNWVSVSGSWVDVSGATVLTSVSGNWVSVSGSTVLTSVSGNWVSVSGATVIALVSGQVVTISGQTITTSKISGEIILTQYESINTVILLDILKELGKINIQLALITDNEFTNLDLG